jgi:hypothetical protein
MFEWRQRLQDYLQERNQAAENEAPNAIDEFGAADKLDNSSPRDEVGVFLMEDALEDLRARHLPFRRAEKCEECDLEELRLQILTEVTSSEDLEDYYRDAWGVGRPNEPFGPVTTGIRRVAVMQIELMVRAFTVLQLQRFGNAPENRGWMVLFRAWGRSSRFQRVFDELKPTLAPDFADFYRLYLHDLPQNASMHRTMPVHHPWLKPKDARGVGFFMDSGIVEGEIDVEVRPGTGGITDPRGSEGADQTFEKPSDSGDQGGGQPAPNE